MAKVKLKAKPGQKSITFTKGGLHHSLHVPENEKIPASKRMAALHGNYGKRAAAQARFAQNVLTGHK